MRTEGKKSSHSVDGEARQQASSRSEFTAGFSMSAAFFGFVMDGWHLRSTASSQPSTRGQRLQHDLVDSIVLVCSREPAPLLPTAYRSHHDGRRRYLPRPPHGGYYSHRCQLPLPEVIACKRLCRQLRSIIEDLQLLTIFKRRRRSLRARN